jgi:hypothetical protein
VQNKCQNVFRHLSKCLFVTTDIQFWSWLGLWHWEFFCNVRKQSWCVSLEISISETWLTSTCAEFELLWNLKNLRGFLCGHLLRVAVPYKFWLSMVWESPGGPNQYPLYGPFYAHLVIQGQAMMNRGLPHMLVTASVRPNLFFYLLISWVLASIIIQSFMLL